MCTIKLRQKELQEQAEKEEILSLQKKDENPTKEIEDMKPFLKDEPIMPWSFKAPMCTKELNIRFKQAAQSGDKSLFDHLLQEGPTQLKVAFRCALSGKHLDILKTLHSMGVCCTQPYLIAIRNAFTEGITMLVEWGIPISEEEMKLGLNCQSEKVRSMFEMIHANKERYKRDSMILKQMGIDTKTQVKNKIYFSDILKNRDDEKLKIYLETEEIYDANILALTKHFIGGFKMVCGSVAMGAGTLKLVKNYIIADQNVPAIIIMLQCKLWNFKEFEKLVGNSMNIGDKEKDKLLDMVRYL
jgi:hypothetical protein